MSPSISSQALQAIPAGHAQLEKKMRSTQGNQNPMNARARTALVLAVIVGISLTGCAHAMGMMRGVRRPAITEFGLGPRTSANGVYVATLQPERALKPRQMMTVGVTIADAAGRPIEDATITIDGGMPEHGHGLPTRPRMTRALTAGAYEVEGVRFNMGGWWEFKLTITSARGTDTVTFNLAL
jgi:hypothetical protein